MLSLMVYFTKDEDNGNSDYKLTFIYFKNLRKREENKFHLFYHLNKHLLSPQNKNKM